MISLVGRVAEGLAGVVIDIAFDARRASRDCDLGRAERAPLAFTKWAVVRRKLCRAERLARLVRHVLRIARSARRTERAKVACLTLAPWAMVVEILGRAPRLTFTLARIVLEFGAA